jgi:hypothetical protein
LEMRGSCMDDSMWCVYVYMYVGMCVYVCGHERMHTCIYSAREREAGQKAEEVDKRCPGDGLSMLLFIHTFQ